MVSFAAVVLIAVPPAPTIGKQPPEGPGRHSTWSWVPRSIATTHRKVALGSSLLRSILGIRVGAAIRSRLSYAA